MKTKLNLLAWVTVLIFAMGASPVAFAKKGKGGKSHKSKTGLQYEEVVTGKGPEAKSGDDVSVHYTGTLTNGTKFDSSKDRNQPFTFKLGAGQVIKGWDEGVAGMKVGGSRKLTIPPDLGYGAAGAGPIPPNSTLLFDVELLTVNGKGLPEKTEAKAKTESKETKKD